MALELLQKTQIIIKKQTEIVDPGHDGQFGTELLDNVGNFPLPLRFAMQHDRDVVSVEGQKSRASCVPAPISWGIG